MQSFNTIIVVYGSEWYIHPNDWIRAYYAITKIYRYSRRTKIILQVVTYLLYLNSIVDVFLKVLFSV